MGKDEGNCPYCGAVNSYSIAKCRQCGEELPWANWVQARRQPSSAIGAERSLTPRRTEAVSDGISLLPRGAWSKIILVIIGLAVIYFAVTKFSSSMHQLPLGATASGTPGGQPQSIKERFKNANPVIQQDQQDRQEKQR